MLLQAAFSAFAFAEEVPGTKRPGFYRRVLAERMVAGRIVALRSDHDRALSRLYPAVTWGHQVERTAPTRGRRARVREVVARSAMGAVGALGVGALEVDLVEAQKTGHPAGVVTVDGSRVVTRPNGSSAPTATSTTTRSRTLVLLAAGLLTGGPAGLRPVPVSPFDPPHPVDEEGPDARHARTRRRPAPNRGPARTTAHVTSTRARRRGGSCWRTSPPTTTSRASCSPTWPRWSAWAPRPGVVEILAQVDRSPGKDTSKGNWHGTRRYYVTRGADPRRINSRLLADLGPTNTGDPGRPRRASSASAPSAIPPARRRCPPEPRLGLLRAAGDAVRRADGAGDDGASRARRHRRRPIFHTTRERLLETAPASRGIAYDDGAADCLDNQELKRVLATAHRVLGRKVDLVGMDACLMTMIEVAYQLRDHAQVLVGSEEVEPGPGWPHAAILGDLTARRP